MQERKGRYGGGAVTRGEARRQALLDAATVLFVARGFAQTSLTDIQKRAGGSRNTLYLHFGDKEGLFHAVMERNCARILERMNALDSCAEAPDDPEECLVRYGLVIARTLAAPDSLAILRILIAEGHRIPDIAHRFFHIGPERIAERIADCLRALTRSGRIAVADPLVAAQCLSGMVSSPLLHERLILPDVPLAGGTLDEMTEGDETTEGDIRRMVRLFLRGARADRIDPAGHDSCGPRGGTLL